MHHKTKWYDEAVRKLQLAEFFYQNVLEKDWHIFKILKAQTEKRLPCVFVVFEDREKPHRIEHGIRGREIRINHRNQTG